MNERERASLNVDAAIGHIEARFGEGEDMLEMLMVVAESFRQWRHAPELYLNKPELLPLMLEEALQRIQLERDRRAGNIH
jgi:hypothetical protein